MCRKTKHNSIWIPSLLHRPCLNLCKKICTDFQLLCFAQTRLARKPWLVSILAADGEKIPRRLVQFQINFTNSELWHASILFVFFCRQTQFTRSCMFCRGWYMTTEIGKSCKFWSGCKFYKTPPRSNIQMVQV